MVEKVPTKKNSTKKTGPLTKALIVSRLREEIGLSGRVAKEIVDEFIKVMTETLVEGEVISVTGLGRFSVRMTVERPGRNPRTGEPYVVPARKKVFFTLSRRIREAWHEKDTEEDKVN